MSSFLRSIVSSPKKLYFDSTTGKEYDLAHITSRIIICSGPASTYPERIYRYSSQDLLDILVSNYGNNWHIWNFRSENSGYEDVEFNKQVSHYPFPDRECPPFNAMLEFVSDMYRMLQKDEEMVAVLHCKAGKGRSGMMCCAYLMYKEHVVGRTLTVDAARNHITKERMRVVSGDSISILSQLKYLKYWYIFLNSSDEHRKRLVGKAIPSDLLLADMELKVHCDSRRDSSRELGVVSLSSYEYLPNDSSQTIQLRKLFKATGLEFEETIAGQLYFREEVPITSTNPDLKLSVGHWCYSWFNIFFETFKDLDSKQIDLTSEITGSLILTWEELDGFKGSTLKGKRLFDRIELCWKLQP